MPRSALKRLLARARELGPILNALTAPPEPSTIYDAEGSLLAGESAPPEAGRFAVLLDGQAAGEVRGGARAPALAALLAHLLQQEQLARALASEVLERYREVNLFYSLADKLAVSPHAATIAALGLEAAGPLVKARAGWVLLGDETRGYAPAASWGAGGTFQAGLWQGQNVLGRVLRSGRPAVANDVEAGLYFQDSPRPLSENRPNVSLLCVPLKTETRLFGAILLEGDATRPFSAGDLKILYSVAAQVAPAMEIVRLHEVAIQNARMEQELQTARKVQASLLPLRMPSVPGWEFAAYWQPALEVAGDYYDIIQEKKDQLGLVIADVTDKGMPASLFMVFARSALRSTAERSFSPARWIRRANRLISSESSEGFFVTLFYARLKPESGELTYVNAGHNPPLFYRAGVHQVGLLTRTGMALGVDEDAAYEQRSLQLSPGDLILFYTDGITEAFGLDGTQFGAKRLEEIVLRCQHLPAAELIRALENALAEFTGGATPSDDVTLMVVKRDPLNK